MSSRRPLVGAGFLLGAGLGGFLDGIVFHQILQTHNMVSGRLGKDTVANVEVNMFWDGVFHAGVWAVTVLGVVALFRAARRADVPWSARLLWGGVWLGFGAFNLVEGMVNHHLLHVHHVVERLGHSGWDFAFSGSGVAMIALGMWLLRTGRQRAGLGDVGASPGRV